MNRRHDILAVQNDRLTLRRAQRNMQHSPVLRNVDLVPTEHRIDLLAQTRFLGQLDQQLQRLVGNAILRVVEKNSTRLRSKTLTASRIRFKQLTQMFLPNLLKMGLKGLPRWAFAERYEFCCRLHTLCFS